MTSNLTPEELAKKYIQEKLSNHQLTEDFYAYIENTLQSPIPNKYQYFLRQVKNCYKNFVINQHWGKEDLEIALVLTAYFKEQLSYKNVEKNYVGYKKGHYDKLLGIDDEIDWGDDE